MSHKPEIEEMRAEVTALTMKILEILHQFHSREISISITNYEQAFLWMNRALEAHIKAKDF